MSRKRTTYTAKFKTRLVLEVLQENYNVPRKTNHLIQHSYLNDKIRR